MTSPMLDVTRLADDELFYRAPESFWSAERVEAARTAQAIVARLRYEAAEFVAVEACEGGSIHDVDSSDLDGPFGDDYAPASWDELDELDEINAQIDAELAMSGEAF